MRCRHPRCSEQGEPCYVDLDSLTPDVYYCVFHKEEFGFCLQCGFHLSEEELDDRTGLCLICLMQIDAGPDNFFDALV